MCYGYILLMHRRIIVEWYTMVCVHYGVWENTMVNTCTCRVFTVTGRGFTGTGKVFAFSTHGLTIVFPMSNSSMLMQFRRESTSLSSNKPNEFMMSCSAFRRDAMATE